jgi:hypothetical protein
VVCPVSPGMPAGRRPGCALCAGLVSYAFHNGGERRVVVARRGQLRSGPELRVLAGPVRRVRRLCRASPPPGALRAARKYR